MDNLLAIAVGLGLRALIDTVTHHNHRVDGSLVGLWEGAVLRHFISKYPSSLDPYVAYGFRLFVDLLWTHSWMRLVIVVLWTFMGMLLSDVGVDLADDRRFRRLTRAIRHTIIYPLLSQVSRRRTSSSAPPPAAPSRVQVYQIPATASTTSTARSPAARSAATTDVSVPVRSGAATPGLPRRPALRVPGSFSDRQSETDTDAAPIMSREPSLTSPADGSITSRSSSSRTPSVTFSDPLVSQTRPAPRQPSRTSSRPPPVGVPVERSQYPYSPPINPPLRSILSPPIIPLPVPLPPPVEPPSAPQLLSPPYYARPQTPSELEYVAIPAIPDNIEQLNPVRPRPVLSDDERSVGSGLRSNSDRSGLTTPTSDTERPPINVYSPEPVNSGLTTPANRPSTPRYDLPPVRVLDEAAGTPSVASRNLSDVNPIPIPIRVYERNAADDAEQVKASLLHPELLPDISTPQPSPGLNPPAQFLPTAAAADEKRPMRMPEPQLPSDVGTSRFSTTEPPPAYEHIRMPGDGEGDEDTPAASVISNLGDRQRLLQRAESLRDAAEEADKKRARLKKELQDAIRNKQTWTAFRLKHEIVLAEKETKEANAKAARRFYQAHNMKPEPQTIDVHRLKITEAQEKVQQALYDALQNNANELRVIVGRGLHSKKGIPALKLAILDAMTEARIDASTDPNNPGVIVIPLPHSPSGPSS